MRRATEKVYVMQKIAAAAIVLSFTAGIAGASPHRGLDTDCGGALLFSAGPGAGGQICTGGARSAGEKRMIPGADRAENGAFYPLGMGHGIAFDEDPAFVGAVRAARAADSARLNDAAVDDVPAGRGVAAAGGTRARGDGRGRSAEAGAGTRGAGNGGGSGVAPGLARTAPGLAGTAPGLALPAAGAAPLFDIPAGLENRTESPPVGAAPTTAPAPIPLPAAGLLLLGGLGALGVLRRRRARVG